MEVGSNIANVRIIGGGLAGCEAAFQLAKRGILVELYEMRPQNQTAAHQTDHLAELVCSNSFRSDSLENAVGLLHQEMRILGSVIMECADQNSVPAGGALAVDRVCFAQAVEEKITKHPNITLIREEVGHIDSNKPTIIATGPLSSNAIASEIMRLTDNSVPLAFFDAIAPIVYSDSIDYSIAWKQSRYDKGSGDDYINCPMNKEQYYSFVELLRHSEKTEFKEWEKNTPYFDGCLPIEIMAERGVETLRFGPMKPVGLTNPHPNTERPYAVVQLRQDNHARTLYNIVGFQTKLKYNEQTNVFRTIPGLENAEFARLGGIHRNTFINSPALLNSRLQLKTNPNIRFAGQITGVEGYVESAAIGLLAGIMTASDLLKYSACQSLPPRFSALGSLLNHITGEACIETFQPMNINYGLFPVLNESYQQYFKDEKELKSVLRDKLLKKQKYAEIAINNIKIWNGGGGN